MTIPFDDDTVETTPQYLGALYSLLRAKLKMLADAEHTNSDNWTWGVCVIDDLTDADPYQFQFGPADAKPEVLGESRVGVFVKDPAGENDPADDYFVWTPE